MVFIIASKTYQLEKEKYNHFQRPVKKSQNAVTGKLKT